MKCLKKIFRSVACVVCAVSVLCLTCINAFATAGIVVTGGVIALLGFLLVASGAASQSQVNTMPDSSIIEMAKTNVEILPRYMSEVPKNIIVDALTDAADITHAGYSFLDFVFNHKDLVSTAPGESPELSGYGAAFLRIDSEGKLLSKVCGDYGVFKDNVPFMYSENHGYTYSFILGEGTFTDWTQAAVTINDPDFYFYGDWRYADGTPADDLITFPDAVASPIGTVNIDGKDYPVNADGTVTVGDQTYTINKDGSVTVNEGDDNRTYSPTYNFEVYDDTAIQDLIQDLIDTVESSRDNVSDEVQAAVNAEIMDFTLSPTISTVFPFCIPWDFVRGMKLLATEPEAPRFEVPFDLPEFGLFPGSENTVVIDFEEYSKYFNIVRWGFYLLFCFGLCFLSFKIVKGV